MRTPSARRASALALGALAVLLAAATATFGASSTTVVTMDVPSASYLDAAGCAPDVAGVTAFGVVLPGSDAVTSADCTVGFGSSNDTATLLLHQLDGAETAMHGFPHGGVDTSWAAAGHATVDALGWGANDNARDVVVLDDGRLLTTGSALDSGGTGIYVMNAVRLLADGSPDPSFAGDGSADEYVTVNNHFPERVVAQSDDRVVVGGYAFDAGSGEYWAVTVRFTAGGATDSSWSGDGRQSLDLGSVTAAWAMAIQDDDKVVLAGRRDSGDRDVFVARYRTDGTLDPTFDGDGIAIIDPAGQEDQAEAVIVQPDGRILVGGYVTVGGVRDGFVARLDPDGSLDTSFDGDGLAIHDLGASESVRELALQPDGKVVVGAQAGGDVVVARLTTAGALDTSFSGDGMDTVDVQGGSDWMTGLLVQDDGMILTLAETSNGVDNDIGLVRHTTSGALHDPMGDAGIAVLDLGTNEAPNGIAAAGSGRVYVAGRAGSGGGDQRVTRFDADAIADLADGVADWNDGTTAFGACLRALSGAGAVASWSVDGDGDCTAIDTDPWQGLARAAGDAGALVATSTTAGSTSSVASLRFGMRTEASRRPGSYLAPLAIEVVAPAP